MTSTATPEAALASRRILVCVGSGGVGKTTVAASLALQGARTGRRALVVTIDPARRLADAGCENVTLLVGDGSAGWPEHAPFDKVLVAAAPELIPVGLLDQLRPGGRMVIPAGIDEAQKLMLVTRGEDARLNTREVLAVRFSELVVGDSG